MSESTTKHLDIVLMVLREQRKAVDKIKRTQSKQIGSYYLPFTDDEKHELIQRTQRQYQQKVALIYNHMNTELKTNGCEPLINPFT